MKAFSYKELIIIENLFQAWYEFRKGKRRKLDVMEFERNLEDNLFLLFERLKNKTFRHSSYKEFYVNDPKRRHIHKARVSDRIVHHLLYKYLYEVFDKRFIFDSYSCRNGKGTHRAVRRLESFVRKVSKNYTSPCFILHLDIKKFFASVDHEILFELLKKKIHANDILDLLKEVIKSFETEKGKGIPLGNLTSQVFANIYLNELDYFVKYTLQEKHYIRYSDDFVIVLKNDNDANQMISRLDNFLKNELKLTLHPDKIIFRKLEWGVDFLGYIVLPHYILPRTKTKRRMYKKINVSNTLSYLSFLSHANSFKIQRKILQNFLPCQPRKW